MKPTIINLIFAIFYFWKNIFRKNFLELFFKTAFQLSEEGWTKINNRWALFFYIFCNIK